MTIEERAKELFPESFYDVIAQREAYIQGATEQKQIDIDKACEWLKKELVAWGYNEDEAPIYEFRKVMEE